MDVWEKSIMGKVKSQRKFRWDCVQAEQAEVLLRGDTGFMDTSY